MAFTWAWCEGHGNIEVMLTGESQYEGYIYRVYYNMYIYIICVCVFVLYAHYLLKKYVQENPTIKV